jgi:hypothetical protein
MISMGIMLGGETPEVSPENKARAEKYWLYGADVSELAKAWGKPVTMAELKTCSNCDYFDNRARTLKTLKAEPNQGACTKFKFLCNQEASCQAWDCKDTHMEEED